MIRAVLAAALIALLAAGCGAEDDAPRDAPDDARLTSELRYSREGGIAGRVDDLTIQPDGRAHLERMRPKASLDFTLAPQQLAELAEAARASGLQDADTRGQAAPDAFVHTIEYGDAKVVTDDRSAEGPLKALVGRLGAIADRQR